ncbi:hypothetical protein PHISCL_03680 [Aspergillus sclerotialis]|uniref:Integral membrane protein n=1 Tax=Aspergillus sclerotialis TaxID=2070753 RepID=A0A3A2ZXD7_9EURO|nr:hypothetical protein PHISCL_03680 [Aspergillus sclerotialis]
MQTWIKVFSVIFRVTELICTAIVVGILGAFEHRLNQAPLSHNNGRIIYSLVTGSLGLFVSLLFIVPWVGFFYAFAMDFILFVMFLVAFGLMANLTVDGTCSSAWFSVNWAYYWGRFYVRFPFGFDAVFVDGCASWRANLAFSFISAWIFLCSGIIGILAVVGHRRQREREQTYVTREQKQSQGAM